MKIFLLLCSLLAFTSIGFSQNSVLPPILVPSESAAAEATRLRAKVVKLLPREIFMKDRDAYTEEEFQTRNREGGAFFSFGTGSHTYSKFSDIELVKGKFRTGFLGADYSIFADLGLISLDEVPNTPEFEFASKYQPALTEPNARTERQRFIQDAKIDGRLYNDLLQVEKGHTYLLRAIRYDAADTITSFTVIEISDAGFVTLAYRQLASCGLPKLERD